MKDNWQWCHICYGNTIHTKDTCTQCGNHLQVAEINTKSEQIVSVEDRRTLQWVSYYRISKN